MAALAYCSGDATPVFALGVVTGVLADNTFSVVIDIGGMVGSRIKSGIALTARMVISKDPGLDLLY